MKRLSANTAGIINPRTGSLLVLLTLIGTVQYTRAAKMPPPIETCAAEPIKYVGDVFCDKYYYDGRLRYAVTPRFAPTSTPAQLDLAGRLLAAYPGTYAQTHVAENRDEVKWVSELFPDARSYLDVYRRHSLLGPRTVLAHGIWLDDTDRALLAETGAQIAHSPSSNLFLGSGLMDWVRLQDAGAAVSLASDVGGGTHLSMLRTMAEAYKVQALQGIRLTAWKALYSATRGAARALGLEGEIGGAQAACHALSVRGSGTLPDSRDHP